MRLRHLFTIPGCKWAFSTLFSFQALFFWSCLRVQSGTVERATYFCYVSNPKWEWRRNVFVIFRYQIQSGAVERDFHCQVSVLISGEERLREMLLSHFRSRTEIDKDVPVVFLDPDWERSCNASISAWEWNKEAASTLITCSRLSIGQWEELCLFFFYSMSKTKL
jgi:hypothetical protein